MGGGGTVWSLGQVRQVVIRGRLGGISPLVFKAFVGRRDDDKTRRQEDDKTRRKEDEKTTRLEDEKTREREDEKMR